MTQQSHSRVYTQRKLYLKKMHAPNVHCSTINNSQEVEATCMSVDRGMDKEDVAHIYNGIVLSHKKEWNNATCSNMDRSNDYYTKWKRHISYVCGILKNYTNELIYKTETDSQILKTNLGLPKRKGWREG